MLKTKEIKTINKTIPAKAGEMNKTKKMAAPEGNQFWKRRLDLSEDGKKLSVKQVAEKLTEYIQRCVETKLHEPDWVGKDATEVERPHMIILSIFGASAHLGINVDTWYEWKKDEKYSEIITRAETLFKAYNLEGAGANMINQNIVARIDGHRDQADLTSNGKEISIGKIEFVTGEAKRIADDLDSEV